MMTDVFHRWYNGTFSINYPLLIKIRLPKILRFSIFLLSNAVLPTVFLFSKRKRQLELVASDSDFVVSLTSFPARIRKVHLVIETLLRQTRKPKIIILWLSEEQFPSLDCVPLKLRNMMTDGVLDIQLTPGDLRSYKKYYFQLKSNPDTPFVIVDDDIFYPSNLLELLLNASQSFPNAICANRAATIEASKPYREWSISPFEGLKERMDLLPTGCGGVFYPRGALADYALNKELFLKYCKDADDIWLSCCAYVNKTKTVLTCENQYYLPILNRNSMPLHESNVGSDKNDARFKSVRGYFWGKLRLDVLEREV